MIRHRLACAGVAVVAGVAGCAVPEEIRARRLAADAPEALDRGDAIAAPAPLDVVARLVAGGDFVNARTTLAEVTPTVAALPPVDRIRYHTYQGLVELDGARYEPARAAFQAALDLGDRAPLTRFFLAQACHGCERWGDAVAALDASASVWAAMPRVWSMRAHALWSGGQRVAALGAVADAARRFPGSPELARQEVTYCLELQFPQEAVAAGARYLAAEGRTAAAYLTLGEALRRAGEPEAACAVLEEGRLAWPGDAELPRVLAAAWLDAGRPRVAASTLEVAALTDPRAATEAAELHRRAGDLARALYLNAGLEDQVAKARQRLGILLAQERWSEAGALEPRCDRLGLLADPHVRYAFAYAAFHAGDAGAADAHLARVDLTGDAARRLEPAVLSLRQALLARRDAAREDG